MENIHNNISAAYKKIYLIIWLGTLYEFANKFQAKVSLRELEGEK